MRISKLLMPAVTVACALALAGCGGGGGTTPPTPPGDNLLQPGAANAKTIEGVVYTCTRQVACPFDEDDLPEVGNDDGITVVPEGDQMPPDTLSSLLGEAGEAATDAQAALDGVMDDKTSADVAMTYGTAMTYGQSAVAQANAQEIVDAKATIDDELKKANAALEKATARPDTESGKAQIVKAIKDEIKKIEASQRAAKVLADAVKGGANGKMTPATRGTAVAKAVLAAFTDDTDRIENLDTNGLGTADRAQKSLVSFSTGDGKRFADLFTTVEVRLTSDATSDTKAISVSGKKYADFVATAPTFTIGTALPALYKGIGGALHCVATDCAVEGDTITGSVYFAPTDTTVNHYFIENPASDTGEYMRETGEVEYGHWVVVENGELTVHPFVVRSGPAGTPEWGKVDDEPASATYTGGAAGIAVVTDSDDEATRSGRFTADVSLTATFGAAPTLGGTVSNFQGVSGSGWSATLETVAVDSSAGTIPAGEVGGGAEDGTWTASAFGPAEANPAGFTGGFEAGFKDGHAAGAFGATK